jgi:hypothetical protein
MSTPYTIDNEGIGGGPFLSMTISETNGFTQADIDNNTTACRITGNNEVGKGAIGDKLLGKVVWVSSELVPGTTRPVSCAVQARGVARFYYGSNQPQINQMVELVGNGKVRQASADADIDAGGHVMRGQVIAVDVNNATCDVWLG